MDEPKVIGASGSEKGGVALTMNVVLFCRMRFVRQKAPLAEFRPHRVRRGLGAVQKSLGNGE